MSNFNTSGTGELVKPAYKKTAFKNQKEIDDFVKCCDPESGYLYFMDNFFYIQHPTQGSIQYHPYEYQERLINTYHNYRYSIALMPRQSGKSTSAAGYLLWYTQAHKRLCNVSDMHMKTVLHISKQVLLRTTKDR
jgi:hypothetical protein